MTNLATDSQTITLRPDITIDRQRLSQLCDRWQITDLQLFGSILHREPLEQIA